MQKLFSMFPRGAPGLALLMLRLFVGAMWTVDALAAMPVLNVIVVGVLLASAIAVVIGFATPIAAVAAALVETLAMNALGIHVLSYSFAPIVIALALAMLGPGAYSLDARVFGRRLMEFGPDVDADSPDIDR